MKNFLRTANQFRNERNGKERTLALAVPDRIVLAPIKPTIKIENALGAERPLGTKSPIYISHFFYFISYAIPYIRIRILSGN